MAVFLPGGIPSPEHFPAYLHQHGFLRPALRYSYVFRRHGGNEKRLYPLHLHPDCRRSHTVRPFLLQRLWCCPGNRGFIHQLLYQQGVRANHHFRRDRLSRRPLLPGMAAVAAGGPVYHRYFPGGRRLVVYP